MRTVASPADLPQFAASGVTIGNFDGVHKGHQALVRHTLEVCRQENLACVLVTFWPHPRMVVGGGKAHYPLHSRNRRMELLESLGVEYILELPFDRDMAALDPEAFISRYLVPMNMRRLLMGYDFCLGRGRSGNAKMLASIGEHMGFSVEQMAAVEADGAIVSSTRLRELVMHGDVRAAARLLGRNYGFAGQVVHGDGRGKGLGFPTANLLPPETLLPARGVYATRLFFAGRWWPAVTNIGVKPTFAGQDLTVESFVLEDVPNLYEQQVRLDFVEHLREEQHFASPAELVAQIDRDVATARAILASSL